MNKRAYSTITNAEWICWRWIEVTECGDIESQFVRSTQRPLTEAMKLAGGTINNLTPYLYALRLDEHGRKITP